MWLNAGFKTARFSGIHAVYIAYHIWLSKKSLVFELRRFSTRFVLERALAQAVEIIHPWSTSLALRIPDS